MQLMKYGPKSGLSPTVGDPCPLCGTAFARGDFTTLVRQSINGKYANDGIEVHWDCAARGWPRGTGEHR
jgi:hypothetical protein